MIEKILFLQHGGGLGQPVPPGTSPVMGLIVVVLLIGAGGLLWYFLGKKKTY